MSVKTLPSYEQLKKTLPFWHPKAIYYGIFRFLLQTIGRLSQGIQIGLIYGFDSGVMLEYVYRNQPSGMSFIGKFIDRIYLNSQGWQGIRQRGEILIRENFGLCGCALENYVSNGQRKQDSTISSLKWMNLVSLE